MGAVNMGAVNGDTTRMNRMRPSLLMLRWLALGAAAGAALFLALDVLGLAGPWQGAALVLALLALFAIAAVVFALRQREKDMLESEERARHREAEVSELQRELDRHTQLEQQLRQAKQAAESAVMAKGEFLATMSHEIRTPLNGIVPMLDLLMHAQLQPDHNEWVRTAYLSSQQMLRIVDDILDYSKLEADKLELETTSFNLRELLEGVLQLMERPAQTKGLRLSLQIEPGVRLPVRGDPVRLRQVLGNLISNAVKFTERGSVSVHVQRTGETAAQHLLRFEVRDTGIGITAAAQPRLFQAFSQADASTTRLYGGTGLGLAISKRIVDLMGGRIGVESDPGHGATFWFEVPLLKVHGDMPTREQASTTGRLLLLSADPRLRLRLSMLLPNWGLRVSSVETTQEALDRLRTAANQGAPWAYSIVLADLAGMRNTSVALHRNLERHAVYGDLRLVGLYGDDPVPDELQRSITLLSRQAPDADLRAALTSAALPAAVAAPAVESTSSPLESTPETPMRPARVLLVEDNPVNLMVGQRLLSVLGVNCDTASNGEAALLRMSASRYDVVLMDCQMPVMDGYTATRRWRENEEAADDGRHLAIVAMTANAMAGDRQKCLDAGMDDYLAKPVTRSELERCLHRWWNPRATDSAADHTPVDESEAAVEHVAEAASEPLQALADSVASADSLVMTSAVAQPMPSAAAIRGSRDVNMESSSVGEPAVPTAPQRPPQPAVLDLEIVEELRALLGGEVDRLIAVFLEDTPRLIQALESAAVKPDYAGLREAAHSLKSSSANLGAMSLSAAAKRVELGARAESLERPAVAVAVIANEFARARHALLGTTSARNAAEA
jgi:signal transduction histidine kinase/CheY-like chemotaxis protein